MHAIPVFVAEGLHSPSLGSSSSPSSAVTIPPGQVDPQKAAVSLFSRLSLGRFLPAGDGAHHTGEKEREKEKEEWEADLAKRDAGAETLPSRAGKSTSRADTDDGTAQRRWRVAPPPRKYDVPPSPRTATILDSSRDASWVRRPRQARPPRRRSRDVSPLRRRAPPRSSTPASRLDARGGPRARRTPREYVTRTPLRPTLRADDAHGVFADDVTRGGRTLRGDAHNLPSPTSHFPPLAHVLSVLMEGQLLEPTRTSYLRDIARAACTLAEDPVPAVGYSEQAGWASMGMVHAAPLHRERFRAAAPRERVRNVAPLPAQRILASDQRPGGTSGRLHEAKMIARDYLPPSRSCAPAHCTAHANRTLECGAPCAQHLRCWGALTRRFTRCTAHCDAPANGVGGTLAALLGLSSMRATFSGAGILAKLPRTATLDTTARAPIRGLLLSSVICTDAQSGRGSSRLRRAADEKQNASRRGPFAAARARTIPAADNAPPPTLRREQRRLTRLRRKVLRAASRPLAP
ncbi:hypothetical protein FB451DRAFT_1518071 [Mycena latifolia]|nr:hypothetical protein FB451DRAFT_1518071 [Mycena latifolia]